MNQCIPTTGNKGHTVHRKPTKSREESYCQTPSQPSRYKETSIDLLKLDSRFYFFLYTAIIDRTDSKHLQVLEWHNYIVVYLLKIIFLYRNIELATWLMNCAHDILHVIFKIVTALRKSSLHQFDNFVRRKLQFIAVLLLKINYHLQQWHCH